MNFTLGGVMLAGTNCSQTVEFELGLPVRAG